MDLEKMKMAVVNMSRLNLDYMVQSEVTLPDGRTRYIAISKFDGAMYDIVTLQSHDEARILREPRLHALTFFAQGVWMDS